MAASLIGERRHLQHAALDHKRTTSVERAAAWRVGGARQVPLEQHTSATVLHLRVGNWNGAEQCLAIWMYRAAIQFTAFGDLDDLAEIHHCNAVGDVLHHIQPVSDEQVGQAEPVLKILKEIYHLCLDRDIQG